MRRLALSVFCLLLFINMQAQILPSLPSPQASTIQPVTNQYMGSGSPSPNINPAAEITANANNGVASYEADKRRVESDKIQQQQMQKQIYDDVREAFYSKEQPISYSLPSHRGDQGAASYLKAYDELNAMLTDNAPISLKRAAFIVENAYFENAMSYDTYNAHVQNLAEFCRLRMKQEHIDTKDNVALNNLLFRFMSDTLTVADPKTEKTITHYPVHYDFDDFYGKNDWSKMFVTKLMNTNFGQCHSMPLLYGILADEIGAKAYLSSSPSHLFIKYKKGNGFQNVELTNGHLTTDAYVIGSGYIKSEAIKSRLYLDTLSPKEAIALMMQDLGKGYYVKYGFDDFVMQCANTGLQYYPNDAYGMAIKSDYNTILFQYVVNQMGGKPPSEVLAIPQARQLYANVKAIYKEMDDAGFTQMPEQAYEDWLKSIDKEKRKQEYELFLKYQQSHKSTIWNEK